MSNHDGSYLLNEVLLLLDKQKVFDFLGKEKTLAFLNEIRTIGNCHDCNNGEILDGIGGTLKVCYCCWNYSNKLEDGICEQCESTWKRKI